MFESILLASNNEESRSFFYEAFTNIGYKITTVPTHTEVLDILRKERPDFIILDPSLTDISAQEVLGKIRIIDKNIITIMLSPDRNKSESLQTTINLIKGYQNISRPKENTRTTHTNIRILVVDDEKECSELVKNYLTRKGYNVDMAFSGEEALLKIKSAAFNIVLLDIHMTGIDGMAVLKTIKDIDKTIKVLMTTALENKEITRKALELGADGYLVKPFNLSELENALIEKTLTNET